MCQAIPGRKEHEPRCADCGGLIGRDGGPGDGWQLEDGRTVCNACCVLDTELSVARIAQAVH